MTETRKRGAEFSGSFGSNELFRERLAADAISTFRETLRTEGVIPMKTMVKKLVGLMVLASLLVVVNAAMAEEKKPSGTVTIDETQIMWIVGGDIGGGTLELQGQSYGFKMDGLKLGGFGVHQVKLEGDVWDLNDVVDFPGVYAEAEVGYTAVDAGEGDFWLQNDKGVKLRLKSPASQGVALDLGVEGANIRME